MNRISLKTAVLLAVLLIGCNIGCSKRSNTASIHGHVSYRGQPLNASSVTFFPATGRPVTATAPTGEYSTSLAPGDYTVVVEVGIEYPKGFKEGDPQPAAKVVLPEQYTSRTKSLLKATVAARENKTVDFELK